jgi:hypothetical protein
MEMLLEKGLKCKIIYRGWFMDNSHLTYPTLLINNELLTQDAVGQFAILMNK